MQYLLASNNFLGLQLIQSSLIVWAFWNMYYWNWLKKKSQWKNCF